MQESLEPPAPVVVDLDTPPECEDGDELALAERIAASVGAWVGGLLLRCAPPSGPFFTSDGRLAAHGASFRAPPEA